MVDITQTVIFFSYLRDLTVVRYTFRFEDNGSSMGSKNPQVRREVSKTYLHDTCAVGELRGGVVSNE